MLFSYQNCYGIKSAHSTHTHKIHISMFVVALRSLITATFNDKVLYVGNKGLKPKTAFHRSEQNTSKLLLTINLINNQKNTHNLRTFILSNAYYFGCISLLYDMYKYKYSMTKPTRKNQQNNRFSISIEIIIKKKTKRIKF